MKIKFIIIVFSIVWIGIIVRIFFLAVESNVYYKKLSHQNTIKNEEIAPVRGEIVDRNNQPIAINKLGFKIKLAPHLRSKKKIDTFNDELDNIITLFPKLDRDFIPYEDMLAVYTTLNLRENIKIIPAPKRYYPYENIGAHIIGYVSRANRKDIDKDPMLELIGYTGKTGIEKYYNGYLQGTPGKRKIKVNANNQEIEELEYESADEDRKLTLSLDIELQKYISGLFKKKVGAVVVMSVDGAILAAGSFPNYDLNIFVSGMSYDMYNDLSSSLDHPFTNKLINGLYPPGSTIKPTLGLLYITTDLNEKWKVDCKSHMPLGKRIYRCWKKKGHGITDVKKAIRESCDDFFYKGSLILGNQKMSEGFMRYGLGQKTGVDLPNEFIGIVPSREWKRKKYNRNWNIGETVNTSIGQGDFLTTPLQMAQQTALIATAKLPTPHLAKMIGNEEYESEFRDVYTKKELKKLPLIQKAMYEVCNYPSGTATHYLHSKVKIAGKTGTAQVVAIKQDVKKRKLEHEMAYYRRSHAWFTSYGPYKNPQYIVLVMIEHGGHGGHAAGGIISDIYNKLLELDYIKK